MSNAAIPVMYFSNTRVRGGAEEHILTLLRGLDRNGFRLHLVCSPEVAEAVGVDLPRDVELLPLRFGRPSDAASAVRLGTWIRERKIQVLHSHLSYSSWFASPVGWSCGVPLIVETPHIRELWRKGWKADTTFDRMAARLVDRFIAVSHANAKYLVEHKGLPARKIRVIQNGSDLSRFNPSHVAPEGMREELGLAPNDPVMLVAARLEPQKGHAVLLDAMPAVLREFPTAKLVCLGEGVLRDQLEEQSRRLGLQASVRFIGFRRNVQDWLSLCDFTVLPSFFEGLPLVAIESLAAGRTMVASAVDGTPEVIVNGQTGVTVPSGDSAALSEAICSLLRSPDYRDRLAQQGRAWVLDHFTQERQVRETGELYLEGLGRPSAAASGAMREEAVAQ